ncbi:redoxin domain-containing protein [Ktedonospora formicarum]|uniref:Peroxiredoxin n=1 Tax=Ktedonospora formicarum TaxID=2778364 RepID=A0A8J3MS39_9CHLR|nr:redoxin domain-containing protein [Ktedonospora formicarum]GHO42950.1 peroxiredoxin [Ktedonospora formicarum]
MTENQAKIKLIPGEIIPAFTLPGPDGIPHSPWDYKQRENLLLLFVPSLTNVQARAWISGFAKYYREFRDERCAILALTPDPVVVNLEAQEELSLPFPLLADPQGRVIARFTRWDSASRELTPGIVLTDRYNALYQHGFAVEESERPSIDDVLASLRHINTLCTP